MKILIAEDQVIAGLALSRTLEQLGHEAIIVSTGDVAWEQIEQQDWRLVITDWMMPGCTGPELCRRIRSRRGHSYTYVILLTCRDSRMDRLEGLAAGADDFLTKPVDVDELAVRLAIARRILGVQADLEAKNLRLTEIATTDPLTGLANRRRLNEALAAAASLSFRRGVPCSVLMLDIDHFKSFNDAFGHSAGDDVLCAVANILRSEVRPADLAARHGGEEFVVLLPGTDSEQASHVAERLRAAIASADWPLRPVTASVGIATSSPPMRISTIQSLLDAADRALYHSKKAGRDRVSHHHEMTLMETAIHAI